MDRWLPPAFSLQVCVAWLVVGGGWLGGAATPAKAGELQLSFDVGYLVECRDVTPPEYAHAHPGEKLVEAQFRISAYFQRGSDDDLVEFVYEIESPQRTLFVVDFEPKTEMASSIVGPMSIERSQESNRTAGIGVSGRYTNVANAEASASLGSKDGEKVRFDRLPALELLAASGTTQRGHGVYFKLRPSDQVSLEGARQLLCVFRVPHDWRGDMVRLKCHAVGHRRGLVPGLPASSSRHVSHFEVGLYLQGNVDAAAIMNRRVQLEQAFRSTVQQHYRELQSTRFASPIPGVASFRAMVDPASLAELQTYLIRRGQAAVEDSRLPQAVRGALHDYRVAWLAAWQLTGDRATLARTN